MVKFFCNEFFGRDFFIWFGKDCDWKCIFGKKIDFEICICYYGYWGLECGNFCFGGVVIFCNNNGMCDSGIGKCECYVNYNGIDDCSVCFFGWIGVDCFFVLVIVRKVYVLIVVLFIGGYYVIFDGYSFIFVVVGEYYFLFDFSLLF